jgi:hypothetical protein
MKALQLYADLLPQIEKQAREGFFVVPHETKPVCDPCAGKNRVANRTGIFPLTTSFCGNTN